MALKVEFEELEELAGDIMTNKEECDDMISETASIVDALVGDGFEGSAADAFNDKFDEVKESLHKAMEAFQGMSEMLSSIATAMRETDEEMAEKVSNAGN